MFYYVLTELLRFAITGGILALLLFAASLSWWAFSVPQTKVFKSIQYTYRQIKTLTKESF